MKDKINALKERYVKAESEREYDTIRQEIAQLCDEDAGAVAQATLQSITETNTELLRERLKEILPIISVSHLSKTYFYRSPQWFYQRLNGNAVNGKPARFTEAELKVLHDALRDISGKINASASVVF